MDQGWGVRKKTEEGDGKRRRQQTQPGVSRERDRQQNRARRKRTNERKCHLAGRQGQLPRNEGAGRVTSSLIIERCRNEA